MLRPRLIPSLLLRDECIIKTIQFNKFQYIGDPCNTVRIFNELEVDELFLNDILASINNQKPNFKLLKDIANECFMPLAYGGGIKCLDDAKQLFDIGFEKILLNTNAIINPRLISEIATQYGSQAVVISIDVKKTLLSGKKVFNFSGKKNTNLDPLLWAKEVEGRGSGEILLTSIDNEGTRRGFDFELISTVAEAVDIPVIASGGMGKPEDMIDVVGKSYNVNAVAMADILHYNRSSIHQIRNFAKKSGIKVRNYDQQ